MPALKFEIWKLVGWKCSLPLSQMRAVSSASAGAKVCTGILGELRIGDVTLHAMHRQAAGQRAAAADLDRVAEFLLARRFADDAPVDLLTALAQRFDHLLGAVDRGAFLVAGDQVGDRALVLRVRLHEVFGGRDHGGERALHVGGAAAKQQAITHCGLERVAFPFFERAGGHHVGVSREAQHRAALAARRPEVVHVAITQVFDLETGLRKPACHDFLAALVGRGDGVSPEEIEREVDGG